MSLRSHAVLTALVRNKQKLGLEKQTLQAKLTLVDLAGSERASENKESRPSPEGERKHQHVSM